jgi:hypothetical protein
LCWLRYEFEVDELYWDPNAPVSDDGALQRRAQAISYLMHFTLQCHGPDFVRVFEESVCVCFFYDDDINIWIHRAIVFVSILDIKQNPEKRCSLIYIESFFNFFFFLHIFLLRGKKYTQKMKLKS